MVCMESQAVLVLSHDGRMEEIDSVVVTDDEYVVVVVVLGE